MPLNNIVSNLIKRGGGSVIVSSAGAISLTPLSGQVVNLVGGLTFSGDANAKISRGGANQVYAEQSLGIGATLTVSGTGTHTFSGRVKVSGTSAAIDRALWVDTADTGGTNILAASVANAKRLMMTLATTTNDLTFNAYTGAAGSETYTEAMRIFNIGAYVSALIRFGVGLPVGTAPSYPFDLSGNFRMLGYGGINAVPDTATARLQVIEGAGGAPRALYVASGGAATQAALFAQSAASATVPVVVVKLGATPGAGGDALQVQDSTGAVLAKITSGGSITADALVLIGTSNIIDITTRTTPGNPSAGSIRLWYDTTVNAFKYVDSAGVTKTITAA